MRPLLIFVLCAAGFAQSQKQPTTNKQNPETRVQKAPVNHPVPDTRQPNPDPIVKEVSPIEGKVSSEPHKEQERAHAVNEINDTLLVIFTFFLVVVGGLQWHVLSKHEEWMRSHDVNLQKLAEAAKKNAEVAESALKLGQRADVLLDGAQLHHGQVMSHKDAQVILRFRNFGQTRADEAQLSLYLVIDGVPPTDCTRIPPVVIGAGDTQKVCSPRFVEFLNEKTATGVFSGRTALIFRGEVTYKDIFGGYHRSYYEGTYNVGTGTFQIDKQDAD